MDYSGDPALRTAVEAALKRVVDPEMAVDILELGLVYAVTVGPELASVRLTMTSPACPVTEIIVEDTTLELGGALGRRVDVEIVWDPPWTPERMSDAARRALGDM
jgi:metal-sulfur cluster biosynthetic enzyme